MKKNSQGPLRPALAGVRSPGNGRLRKIEAELQRVLAELIVREVKDPRVGNVTITGVRLAADMGVAKIFYAPFASTHSPEEVQSGLTRASGFLRGEAGRRLGLRHAPRLDFEFDDTAQKAAHLTGLIDRAVRNDRG
ncbi:MAG TPA: 30S ribosome-binding factor RbfA [Steroidobacteraceae bacterium]|jgi:ribosome-binding factor A|nr:30S ribosome-binding factor RbfA [Steroidobacteraceae bacterium]